MQILRVSGTVFLLPHTSTWRDVQFSAEIILTLTLHRKHKIDITNTSLKQEILSVNKSRTLAEYAGSPSRLTHMLCPQNFLFLRNFF
jgi:hypothetical protein